MRLTPPEFEFNQKDPFDTDSDTFGYREFAENFTSLVCNLDQPLTVLFDGPWGSGKSTFVRQWACLLENRGVPVIRFDAFANDHHEDAFIALAGEILGFAAKNKAKASSTEKLQNKAKKVGAAVMPLAARIGMRAATVGLVNLKDIEDMGEIATEIFKQTGENIAEAAEQEIKRQLDEAKQNKVIMNEFRFRLHEIATELSDKAIRESGLESHPPLVFIIDELDRCRPSFALSLLERIKHLFSVSGIVFVLVTNLEQLSAAVRGAYGQETNGDMYLEKFYDLRAFLPKANEHGLHVISKYVDYLWRNMNLNSGNADADAGVRKALVSLSIVHDVSLRTIERILSHVALNYAALSQRTVKLSPLISLLCFLRQVNPKLYEQAKQGKLEWETLKNFLEIPKWPANSNSEWYGQWCQYFTDTNLDETQDWVQSRDSNFWEFSMPRSGWVPWGTQMIDNFRIAE